MAASKVLFKLYLLLPLIITQWKYSPEKRMNEFWTWTDRKEKKIELKRLKPGKKWVSSVVPLDFSLSVNVHGVSVCWTLHLADPCQHMRETCLTQLCLYVVCCRTAVCASAAGFGGAASSAALSKTPQNQSGLPAAASTFIVDCEVYKFNVNMYKAKHVQCWSWFLSF